jgi:iron complex transport system ATP-binding protein
MTGGLALSGVGVGVAGRRILDSVSLTVPAGSWASVIGPNGAGKTTLLRCVAGLVAHEGTITLDGDDLDGGSPRRRARRLAYVPQLPVVPPGMTVADYVLLGRTAHLGWFEREGRTDLDLTHATLTELDLADRAGQDLATLSGGELHRASLARALVQEARLVLLDEPTASLDVGHQQSVLALVDRLRRERGLTVVTTMHDLTLAGRWADHLVLLADGRIRAGGGPEEVLRADVLSSHYGGRVEVVDHPRLGRIVVPAGAGPDGGDASAQPA